MNIQTLSLPEHRSISLEQALAFLACALALVVRFLNLGAVPLSDAEARWALQSLSLANASVPAGQIIIGEQPAYIMLTSWSFQLFGATNFLARFWPALAGCGLVLTPFFFRRQFGRSIALIAAFGLALDPGLVAVSRQAGGPMMALACGLLALGLWNTRRRWQAGVLLGLALLGGPAVIQGFIGLGVAWLAYRLTNKAVFFTATARPAVAEIEHSQEAPDPVDGLIQSPRLALYACALTILVVGVAFFRYPQGLAAWMQSLVTYLAGWSQPSGVNPFTSLAILAVFQPLALVFAALVFAALVFAPLRSIGWRISGDFMPENNRSMNWLLAFWLLASLVLNLLYPARQISDLVWTLIPLWGLAAVMLDNFLPQTKPNIVSLLQGGLMVILAALLWNTLISTSQLAPTPDSSPVTIRLILLSGITLLGLLTTLLVGLGWNWETSRNGLVWGLAAAGLVYSISVLWGATQLRPNQPAEFWGAPPATAQADLLVSTIQDVSNWQTGLPHFVQIQSVVDKPSLRWALRNFPSVKFTSSLAGEEMPAVLITAKDHAPPALTATYRGQDFAWSVWPGWNGILPENLIDWLTFHHSPVISEQIILWVRSDLFPGAAQMGQN